MIDKNEIRSAANETLNAFSPFYQEEMNRHLQDFGRPDNWFALNTFRSQDPEPLTAQQAQQLAPYSSLQRVIEIINGLTEAGFLAASGEQAYKLTNRGRQLIEGFFNGAHEGLASVEPLPAGELDQLKNLLERLVMASLKAPEPVAKSFLLSSRWTDPGDEASLAAQIDQAVTDLNRFRDDAHVAAWRTTGLSGHVWEAFSFVWNQEAGTAAELVEKLPFRGYSEEEYAVALKELVDLGWIEEQDGRYQITAEGKQIRETVEAETDRIFFESWSILNEEELSILYDLLSRTNEKLKADALEMFWPLAGDVSGAIFAATREAINPTLEEYFPNPRLFFPSVLATGSAPEPFSVKDYVRRSPYLSPDRAAQVLAEAAEAGLLSANGGSAYTVTDEGSKTLNTVNEKFYSYLGELEALPAEEVQELEGLLERIVQSSLAVPEPAGHWALSNSISSHPKTNYAPLAKIDQHLDDLNAFRDDAHLSSWKQFGVSGRTWEALTFVWRDQAHTAAELVEQLPFRGFTEDDYAESLAELVERGWLRKSAGKFQITEKGLAIRQEAEEATNRYFYGPWVSLEESELRRLRQLLIRLRTNLQGLVEETQ